MKTAPRAYLLRGDDDFQKQTALNELLKTLVSPDFEDFDLEHIEGDNATCDRVMAGLNVPPFGSTKRVVLIKYANKMSEEEQEKLAAKLVKIPQSGCLIMSNPAADKVNGKAKKGSEVIGTLSRAIRKVGEVKDYGNETSKAKLASARIFAQKLFNESGKKHDATSVSVFVQRVGSDFSLINSEFRKVMDYIGDNPKITQADVEAVTSETPEEKIFKLIDAVAAKNPRLSLKFLTDIFEAGNSPEADAPRTLSMIVRQLRLIWQAKFLQESGVRSFSKDSIPEKIYNSMPKDGNLAVTVGKQFWMADAISKQAHTFSKADLIRCFKLVNETDLALKGIGEGIDDPRLAMEVLVMKLADK